MDLKIVSWNCHYGLTNEKWCALKNFCNDAAIYVIQEVLENEFIDIADFEGIEKYKYRHWYGDHQEYGNCHIPRGAEGDLGIVLISKYRIQRFDHGLIRFRYVVPYILYDTNNEKCILIHVWTKGKPDGYIDPIYKALSYYKEQFKQKKLPIIMIGDFNFGIELNDKYGKKFMNEFTKKLETEIPELKMLELLGENKQSFYYPRYSDKKYFNDCVYAKGITGQFTIGNVADWIRALGSKEDYSDHCPIMAELSLK